MIKKLTALTMSVILTVGLVAAASPTVQTQQRTRITSETMITDCREAYQAYKFRGDENGVVLKQKGDSYPAEIQVYFYMTCLGYQAGFVDGQRMS